jgi:hypothetical protein
MVNTQKLNKLIVDRTQDTRNKKPCIYSVHVHPDGKRLATGSLGKTKKNKKKKKLKLTFLFFL